MSKPKVYRTSQRPSKGCRGKRKPVSNCTELQNSRQPQQPARLAKAPPELPSRTEPDVELKADCNLSFSLNLKVSGLKFWKILVGLARAICSLISCNLLRSRPCATPILLYPVYTSGRYPGVNDGIERSFFTLGSTQTRRTESARHGPSGSAAFHSARCSRGPCREHKQVQPPISPRGREQNKAALPNRGTPEGRAHQAEPTVAAAEAPKIAARLGPRPILPDQCASTR